MKSLDRKLLRDLWSLKTQVVSIALVIACGIGGFIGTFSTYGSLLWSRDNYYATARFPHVFATAKRAPQSLAERIRATPGVVEVYANGALIGRRENGAGLLGRSRLYLYEDDATPGYRDGEVARTVRVGLSAGKGDELEWRFVVPGHPHASRSR